MNLSKLKIVNLVHQGYEDLELWYPVIRLREEGVTVHLAGETANAQYQGKHGVPATADIGFSELNPEAYDGVLIPGGWAPDKLRRDKQVTEFISKMNDQQKPIGEICHAGWVLISAKILQGKRVTSTPAIKDDMENAGAIWTDEAVVVDKNLVSSRRPIDLPIYMKYYIEILKKSYE
ncbi:MAG: type 1 glutamine amidotransferase domain-containing protein [Bacteroidales bacterium]